MSQYYFGISRGQYPQQVAFGNGTSTGTDIEVRIDTSKKLNDVDRQQLLKTIMDVMENPNLTGMVFPGWGSNNT